MAGGSRGERLSIWVQQSCAIVAVLVMTAISAEAEAEFPFERELLLDMKPLPGSKRVPMLEIFADGRAVIDLWCRSGNGRIEVTGEAIKVTLGPMREEGCTPERLQRDEELAAALAQIAQWRMEEDVLVLSGASELRYRLSTH